jgi:hypothetical protein
MGIVNIVLYFIGAWHIRLEIALIFVWGGVMILDYIKDPAPYHQPVKLFPWRHRGESGEDQ